MLAIDWKGSGLGYSAMGGGTPVISLIREVSPPIPRGIRAPTSGKEPGKLLLSLRQGGSSAVDYTLSFRTLAAQTGWEEDPLKLLYCNGLNPDLQSELACQDEGKSLSQFMDLTIHLDKLMRARRVPHLHRSTETLSASQESESMQISYTRLIPEERERRLRNCLCLYCGQSLFIRIL